MKITVVGAGFTGLAVTWHLLQLWPSATLHLVDSKPIGGGTSGIAAGLLHPFVGAHAKLNDQGLEGMEATLELLHIASLALQKPVTATTPGLLRFALSNEQIENFQRCAKKHANLTTFLSIDESKKFVQGCTDAQALWIPSALTVYAKDYLQGLWLACQAKGAQFFQQSIQNLEELEEADLIIFATGAETNRITSLAHLPITIVKGQVLELSLPIIPLTRSVNSQAYLIPSKDNQSCLVGASYERNDFTFSPNIDEASLQILPKAYALYPSLQNSQILNCYAGLRASTPNHLPLIQAITSKHWLISGMGSKGLLYHALYAKKLIKHIKHLY